MKPLSILFIASVMIITVVSQQQKSSALMEKSIYCGSTFSDEQWAMQREKYEEIMDNLHNDFKINTDHLVLNIIRHITHKPNQLQNTIDAFEKETFKYSIKYFVYPIVLVLLSFVACFKMERKDNSQPCKQKKQHNQPLEQRSQVAMASMILICLTVVAISIYGMNQSSNIGLGINQIACRVLIEPTTFLRNSTEKHGLTWLSEELQRFEVDLDSQNQKFNYMVRNQTFRQQLQEITHKTGLTQNGEGDMSSIGKITADLLQSMSNISTISTRFQIQLNRFNMTIEYIRQIIVAYQVLLLNGKKFAQKYVSPDQLMLLSSTLFKTIYFIFILSSIGSLAIISFMAVYENYYDRSLKNNFMYLLGFCFFISLAVTLINSILVPALFYFSQVTTYIQSDDVRLRSQLLNSQALNSQIEQIIVKFHPKSDGQYNNLFRRMMMTDCELLSQQLKLFSSSYSSALQISKPTGSKRIGHEDTQEVEKLRNVVSSIPPEIFNKIMQAEDGINQLLTSLDPIKGKLSLIDSSAFGKNLSFAIDAIRVPILNSAYEQRWIFGFCSIGFSLALFCSIFVEPAKQVVRIKVKEEDSQSLFSNDGDKVIYL